MPLFEYECRACGKRFEYLTRDGRQPICPACESDRLEKLQSAFAVGGATTASPTRAGGMCGMCGDPRGPGACSMN